MSGVSGASGASRQGGDALYELRRALDRVADVSQGVRGDVAEANRVRRRDNLVTAGLGAVIVLLLAAALALTVQNQRLGRQNAEISRQVADCTTAGGACYEDGQRRTADAIAELVRADMAVAWCARQPDVTTVGELETCVAQRLSASR